MENRMSLVVFSGTVDKLLAVATLATGGAAMGMEVDIFLTFWGLEAFRKGAAATNMRLSADYADYGPAMQEAMAAKQVPNWLETLKGAKEIGNVKVQACSMTMELFGHTLADLEDIVEDVTGAASFVEQARVGQITLFI